MYFTTNRPEDAKSEYKELMKKFHPDVTKEDYDTTHIAQEINLEYQRILRNFLFQKDENNITTMNKDIEEELKTAKNVYVNIYKVHPRFKTNDNGTVLGYHILEHVKSKLAYNEADAVRLIKNMKSIKLYEPYLTETKYDKCDRPGFIYRVEYGNVALKDFFRSTINEEERWKSQKVY